MRTLEERRAANRIASKRWRENHPERAKARSLAHWQTHKAEYKARFKKWREANPDKVRAQERRRKPNERRRLAALKRAKQWAKQHPERKNEIGRATYGRHREKQSAAALAFYYANRERILAGKTAYNWRRLYGLTPEQFAALGDRCEICGATTDSRVQAKSGTRFRLCVDHDHTTKRVRGLLCGNCNTGLGYFKDDLALLRNAIAYLEAHNQKDSHG